MESKREREKESERKLVRHTHTHTHALSLCLSVMFKLVFVHNNSFLVKQGQYHECLEQPVFASSPLYRIDIRLQEKRLSPEDAAALDDKLLRKLTRQHQTASKREERVEVNNSSRWFGIGILRGKVETNHGTLWRSAYQLGATYCFSIGAKYSREVGMQSCTRPALSPHLRLISQRI